MDVAVSIRVYSIEQTEVREYGKEAGCRNQI